MLLTKRSNTHYKDIKMKGPAVTDTIARTTYEASVPDLYHLRVIWNWQADAHNPSEKADAAIVPGGLQTPSAIIAAELFLNGLVPYVVTTGGRVYKPNSDILTNRLLQQHPEYHTEADLFAKVARDHGVPDDNILRERDSRNLDENIRFGVKTVGERKQQDALHTPPSQSNLKENIEQAAALLTENNVDVKSVTFCCAVFLLRRTIATAQEKLGDDIKVSAATFCTNLNEYLTYKNCFGEIMYPADQIMAPNTGLAAVCAGEVMRLKQYGGTDCKVVDIPENVMTAYHYFENKGVVRPILANTTQPKPATP